MLLIASNAFAQKSPIKIGDADEKDVKATTNVTFPNVEAIVLCHYGNVTYDLNGTDIKLVFEVAKRIKIFKKSAYSYANISIPFWANGSSKQRIGSIKAYTYNYENGVVVKTKLENSAITEKMIGKNRGEVKFSMPNIKEGSVIEYTYEMRSDYWNHVPEWYFQNTVPTLWSEYRAAIPEYFEFVKLSQGFTEFTIDEINNKPKNVVQQINMECETYPNRWIIRNTPPFKDEKFIASVQDNIIKMEFQLSAINNRVTGRKSILETWEKAIKDLMLHDDYGAYLDKKFPDKEIILALIKDKNTPKEKVEAIYNYVKNTFKYNKKNAIYTTKSMKQVFESKTGSSAEINLMLVNMLCEAKLDAYPVLLSTRSHGKVYRQFPIMDKFNYNIVYVRISPEEEILLDATEPMLPMGMLSYQALNGFGLVVKPNTPDKKLFWANLQNSKYAKTSFTALANLKIDENGLVKGEVIERFGGYSAISKRQYVSSKNTTPTTEDEQDDEILIDSVQNKEINKLFFKNLTEIDKPLDGIMEISLSEYTQINDNFIYLTPLLQYTMKENPMKAEARNFPVDYACATEYAYYMNFIIPDGYKVEELPKSLKTKWKDESLKYEYLVSNADNKIQLVSKFTLNRPIFAPQEYKELRSFYAQIISKQEEQIVLKKK